MWFSYRISLNDRQEEARKAGATVVQTQAKGEVEDKETSPIWETVVFTPETRVGEKSEKYHILG